MRSLLISALSMACAAAQFVTPVPSVMPAWLVPYPSASAQNRQAGHGVESTYTIAALPHDILAHFRTLFASAGLPFLPDPMGHGFLIRAAAPECDLDISIRRRDPETTVKVTCSPRLEANERMANLRAQERAEHAQSDPMKKFDTPVSPGQDGSAPAHLAVLAGPRGWRQTSGREVPRAAENLFYVDADQRSHPGFLRGLAECA